MKPRAPRKMYSPSSFGVFSAPQPAREFRAPTAQEAADWARHKEFQARNDYIRYGIPIPAGMTYAQLGLREPT